MILKKIVKMRKVSLIVKSKKKYLKNLRGWVPKKSFKTFRSYQATQELLIMTMYTCLKESI